jgi:hypothetical protein
MRAKDWRCLFTGRRAEELHHVTGRGPDGEYLDPDLLVPLTVRQHAVEHQTWTTYLIGEDACRSLPILRLLRAGLLLIRLSETAADEIVLPAWFVLELGRFIQRMAREKESGE